MQLFVLPDPNEGLADERPDLGGEVQRVDPADHGLLAIRNCGDLLALQGQEQELLAFSLRVVGVLGPPPREDAADLVEQCGLEITHARTCSTATEAAN